MYRIHTYIVLMGNLFISMTSSVDQCFLSFAHALSNPCCSFTQDGCTTTAPLAYHVCKACDLQI